MLRPSESEHRMPTIQTASAHLFAGVWCALRNFDITKQYRDLNMFRSGALRNSQFAMQAFYVAGEESAVPNFFYLFDEFLCWKSEQVDKKVQARSGPCVYVSSVSLERWRARCRFTNTRRNSSPTPLSPTS